MSRFKQALSKGFSAYENIKQRCNNPKITRYERYGGRGIKCSMTLDEFMFWFIKEIENKDDWHNQCVGRIDHDKDYMIGNIEMQTRSFNSIESANRTKDRRIRPCASIRYFDGFKIIKAHESMADAARFYDLDNNTVVNHCKSGKIVKTRNLRFVYLR